MNGVQLFCGSTLSAFHHGCSAGSSIMAYQHEVSQASSSHSCSGEAEHFFSSIRHGLMGNPSSFRKLTGLEVVCEF